MSMNNNVRVTLGGVEHELVPSLKAATAVSNRFSGFSNAVNALQAADLASIQYIIRQGINLRAISTDQLNEEVWRGGAFKMMTPALTFVSRLANGGRDLNDDGDEAVEATEGDSGNGEV